MSSSFMPRTISPRVGSGSTAAAFGVAGQSTSPISWPRSVTTTT